MPSEAFHDLSISSELRISADWEQSSSPIWWQDLDDDPSDTETWHGTPYQVADAGHNVKLALELVRDWLDCD